jgi:hypothetical protein
MQVVQLFLLLRSPQAAPRERESEPHGPPYGGYPPW